MARSSQTEAPEESYEPTPEPTPEPPKKLSTEERLDALEAYVAFAKPRLASLIGEEPPPPPEPAPEA